MDVSTFLPAALMVSGFFLALGGLVLSGARWMDHRVLDRPTVAMAVIGLVAWGSGVYSLIP